MADEKSNELTPIKPNVYQPADKSPQLNTFTADKLLGVNVDSFRVDSNRLRKTEAFNDFLEVLLIPVSIKSAVIKFLVSFGVGFGSALLATQGLIGLLVVAFMCIPIWILVKLTLGTHLHHFAGGYLVTGIAAFALALFV